MNVTCPTFQVVDASVTPQTVGARGNITITCDRNFELLDGRTSTDMQCKIDGTWNATVPICQPKGCIASDYNQNMFDGDVFSCTTFYQKRKVVIDSVRTTALMVVGHNINCNPVSGNILVLNSAGHCPLLHNTFQIPAMASCHFKCHPGLSTQVILFNNTICEVTF